MCDSSELYSMAGRQEQINAQGDPAASVKSAERNRKITNFILEVEAIFWL